MKRLLRLYPAAWRARYDGELAALLDELPANRGMAVDLVHGALREHARAAWRRIPEAPIPAGGPPMFYAPMHRRPTMAAVVALVLVAPTTIFVALSLVAYELGLSELAALLEPALLTLTAAPVVDGFFLIAPIIALVVAAAPLTGIGLARADRELRLTLALGIRAPNLSAIGVCLVVGALLAWHLLVEGWHWT
ncbi:MAG: hypothetical protein ACRDFR_03015 [Candidatus Limnocylindria bacterium]